MGLAVKVLDPESDFNFVQVGFDHKTLTNSRIGLYRWIPQVEALYKLNKFAKVGLKYSYDSSRNQALKEAGFIYSFDQNKRIRENLKAAGRSFADDANLKNKMAMDVGARLQNWDPNGVTSLTLALKAHIENYSLAWDQWQKGAQLISWLPSDWNADNSYIYRMNESRMKTAQSGLDGKNWWSNIPYPKHNFNILIHCPILLNSENFKRLTTGKNIFDRLSCELEQKFVENGGHSVKLHIDSQW